MLLARTQQQKFKFSGLNGWVIQGESGLCVVARGRQQLPMLQLA
ncbi:hypothetical protein HaLaN_23910 [Haematococcus lacustris]|uniref:Uncharacterized protein n=1 Tax=Haematococcus lacustris TaxID=44745 RepID=A0A6A0A4L7_HAELA|nr:hypothetical protein HaLaN_23910 [Haematococcus lacustris]